MDSESPDASHSELPVERLSRPQAARTDSSRAFSGVWGQGGSPSSSSATNGINDQIMSKGKQKAQERSPDDIAADAVDHGYDMIDEFLQKKGASGAGDAFGIPETGNNQLGGSLEQLLSVLAGGGGLSANVAGMYSQYLQVWNSLFATFLENMGDTSMSGFEDIAGMSSAILGKGQAVILANRSLDVDVNWKQGMPSVPLKLVNLQSMGAANSEVPKGVSVKVRQSLDTNHQVVDVKVPSSVKAGSFSGILVDADGVDYGYLTIRTPAE